MLVRCADDQEQDDRLGDAANAAASGLHCEEALPEDDLLAGGSSVRPPISCARTSSVLCLELLTAEAAPSIPSCSAALKLSSLSDSFNYPPKHLPCVHSHM